MSPLRARIIEDMTLAGLAQGTQTNGLSETDRRHGMEPLYDQSGQAYCWIDRQTGWIISLKGQHLAFVAGDSVYSLSGRHIAWWEQDHVRNHQGAVAVFLANASGLGVTKPVLGTTPVKSTIGVAPTRPIRAVTPIKAVKQIAWAPMVPF